MMLVGAKTHFSASHTLPQHPKLHGHSYEVWAYVPEGTCAEELRGQLIMICRSLDHQHLNDVMDVPPTMENIARSIGYILKDAVRVVVSRPVEGLSAEWTA